MIDPRASTVAGTAVLGDVGGYVRASKAVADFVRESTRGRQIWFVRDAAELERRLGQP